MTSQMTVKSQINKILETAKSNPEYLKKSQELITVENTYNSRKQLKSIPELATEPDENSKNEILKSLEVKSEADLEAKIKSDPKYSQTNLNASQLISFFHTQNQISENPTLKNQLSQNPDFIAFDKNFLKIQDDLNLYKPLRSNALERKTYDT